MTPAAARAAPPPLSDALIDEDSATPLYEQVFAILRERIQSGVYARDEVLPGEQELSRLFGVSRITIKRALNELAAAGFVSRHRGRGTVVTFNAFMPVVKGSFENLLDNLKVMGLRTDVELMRVGEVDAPNDVAELLELEHGARVQRAVRIRKIEGDAFSYLVTYVPLDIARTFDPRRLGDTPLLSLLEAAGFEAVEAEQWITACAADAPLASALRISTGAPLLKIVRVMRDEAGRGVEVLHGFYRPERFQHHMKLTKRRRGGRDEWR